MNDPDAMLAAFHDSTSRDQAAMLAQPSAIWVAANHGEQGTFVIGTWTLDTPVATMQADAAEIAGPDREWKWHEDGDGGWIGWLDANEEDEIHIQQANLPR